MKVIIAPDSFKGNLSAQAVCDAVSAGLKDVDPSVITVDSPLADGGEGTARAITLAAGGVFKKVRVTGPMGIPTEVEFGLIRGGKTAVMDMASASGIELVPREKLDPMKASTYGTGELIKAALDAGVEEIVLGIGGSATSEGGVGMAFALGFEILDSKGKPVAQGGVGLKDIAEVRTDKADPRLKKVSFRVACDVTNPLLGPKGAAAIFGPQKGATPEMVKTLDDGLAKLAEAYKKAGLCTDVVQSGDGAAGGLGATLRILLKSKMGSGARLVMEYADFYKFVQDADLVITGEGMTDAQTAGGKLCSVVADECKKVGVPVALLSGGLGGNVLEILNTYDYAVSIACGQVGLDAMIKDSPRDLRFAAANLMRAYLLGKKATKK
ncbi:MAG: glycerate kinase [Treponemataceae bacterium]